MKFAVVKAVNGNYSIDAEGYTSMDNAIIRWHGTCQALWNEPSVNTACVMIVDENLDKVGDYKEFIRHENA